MRKLNVYLSTSFNQKTLSTFLMHMKYTSYLCHIHRCSHWIRARYTTLCDQVCQWFATGRWCSSGTPVSSTNKTDRHDITEILLRVALNTIKPRKCSHCMW